MMIGQCYFGLVALLLVISPCALAVALLLSHSLVLFLHLLGIGGLPSGVFVLEHASHAKNGFLLRSPISLLLAIELSGCAVLTMLLSSPRLLVFRIKSHSFEVHCIKKKEQIRQSVTNSA